MASSRKSGNLASSHVIQQNENYEMTQESYDLSKRVAENRTGYDFTEADLAGKAVDEKLPMGSQSY